VQGRSKNYFPITGTFFNCSFDKEFGSRACSLGRFKNYFPITGTFFSCSFDKEFGSRACSSGALQKLFSHYWLVPYLTALLTRNLALVHAVQGHFKSYFPITGTFPLTATTCLTVLLISNGF
jgi:hypothetical protein